ncbi:c-type cytochrome [Nitrincola iocasae]|uniref:Cytochrome c n=1 Tax=Nitrincola iocasae TaxID=2614693 RepID=A0A5J6LAM1_9GAMM|nr:cytochrome c [Nitrincola iocasae]QEW05436.1 cytochrome c [Nitrincola iocasae]
MKSILPLLLFMLFLTACDADIPPAKMTSGEQLYGYYCRECHTYRGLGDELQNLPVGISQLQVHDVVLIIKHGYQFGHPMGHFPDLSDEQANTVARYAVDLRRRQREQRLHENTQTVD